MPHAERTEFLVGLRNKAEDAAGKHGRRIGLRGGPTARARQQLAGSGVTSGCGVTSGKELLAASGPVRMRAPGQAGADAETTLIGLPSCAHDPASGGDGDGQGREGSGTDDEPLGKVRSFPGKEAHLQEVQRVAARVAQAVKVACQGAVKAAVSVEVARLEKHLSDPSTIQLLDAVEKRTAIKRKLLDLQREASRWRGDGSGTSAVRSLGASQSQGQGQGKGIAAAGCNQLDRLLGDGAASGTGAASGESLGDVSSDAPSKSSALGRELAMPVRVRISARAVATTRGSVTSVNRGSLSRSRTAAPGAMVSRASMGLGLARSTSGAASGLIGTGLGGLSSPSRSFRLEQRDGQIRAEAEATELRRRAEVLQKEHEDATREVLGLARRQELATGQRFRYLGIRVVQAIACESALKTDAERDEARARARRAL